MCKVTYVAMMHIFIISMVSASENEVGSARMPMRTIQKAPGLISSASFEDLRAPLFQKQIASHNTSVSEIDTDTEDNVSDAGHSTCPSSFAEPLTDQQQRDHSFSVTVSESSDQESEYSLSFDAVQPIVPSLPTDKTMTSATKVAAELMLLQTKKKPCCCRCVIL